MALVFPQHFSAPQSLNQDIRMGKGDKRSFRGKIFKGSHGKTRPGRKKKVVKKRR